MSSLVVREFRAYIVRKISLPGSGSCLLPGLEKKNGIFRVLEKACAGELDSSFLHKERAQYANKKNIPCLSKCKLKPPECFV